MGRERERKSPAEAWGRTITPMMSRVALDQNLLTSAPVAWWFIPEPLMS